MKRWLGVFMAFCMLFTMIQPLAFAAGDGTITLGAVEVKEGDTATNVAVPVSIAGNPGLAGLKIKVTYPDVLTVKNVTFNGVFGQEKDNAADGGNPVTLIWGGDSEVKNDVALATINFNLKSDAKAGTYDFQVEVVEAFNMEETDWTLASETGKLTVTSGSSGTSTKYDITVTTPTNGTVKADKDKAAKDETVTLTVTPATGYELDKLTVNGKEITGTTFTMPGEAVTVAATFKATTTPKPEEYDITVTTPTNGTVKADKEKAAKDETVTLTVTPATGYELDKLTVNGKEITGTTFTMPGEAVTVAATFKATTTPSANGTITLGAVEVKEGDTTTNVAVPVSITGNPGLAGLKIQVTYPNVLTVKNVTFNGVFGQEKDNAADGGNPVTLIWGGDSEVKNDVALATINFNLKSDAKAGTYDFQVEVIEAFNIEETDWKLATETGKLTVTSGSTGTPTKYDITVTTPTNGTLKADKEKADKDETVTLTVTPATGYELDKITVNGKEITGTTFTMPGEAVTVAATFKATTTPEPEKYAITVTTPTNGTVKADKEKAAKDETVTLTVTPATGYELDKITVNGKEITGTTFTMPGEAVTVAATFKATTTPSTNGTITLGAVEVKEGDTATNVAVPISITRNPGLAGLKIKVTYPDVLTIKNVTFNGVFGQEKDNVADGGNPITLIWGGNSEVKGNVTLATINFNLKSDAKAGTYDFQVKVVEAFSMEEIDWTLASETGKLTVTSGSSGIPTKYDITVTTPTNGTVKADKEKAAKDETVTLTVTPATGYELDTLTVNGTAITGTTFTMPGEAVTVAATFKATTTPKPEEYDITVTTPTNGTVKADKEKAAKDETVTLTVTPATGYELDKLTVNGTAITGTTFTMPGEAVTVAATFKATTTPKPEEYDITVTTPTNGTVKADKEKAAKDETVTLTVTPATGYELDTLTVNGTAITGTTFTMPGEAVTVAATFKATTTPEPEKYAITVTTPTNGTVKADKEKAAKDETVTLTVTPATGYELDTLTVNGTAITGTTFTMPGEAVTVAATFKATTTPEPEKYAITVTTPTNGTVTADKEKAAKDETVTLTATPATGYKLDKITVNGETITGTTFTMPDKAVTVAATFVKTDNPSGDDSGSSSGGGCYIATSVYGSYDTPEVWTLRRFRDDVLGQTWYGRLFIKAYYATSPTLVRLFGDAEWFQNFWREKLDTLVQNLQDDGFESTPYQDKDW